MIVCSVQDANILSSSLKYLSLYLLTVASFYPSGFPIAPEAARFLYYYSSVILNLSKNSFFSAQEKCFILESGCKGIAFFNTNQTFQQKS